MQQILIGKTLGKYRITQHLGSGGMSEVYKAHQPGLDRDVAIKVLHSFLATDEDFLSRFRREAKVAAMLRHPNIVRVHDFDHDAQDNVYYMVMEFIDGPSLKTCLELMSKKGQMIPLDEAVRVVTTVADALDYAHRRGTVHRDVKPHNIMFTRDGEVILTDFGIAKMVNVVGLTASGVMVGTPAYMAPEQGMGQTGGNERADIYSLGVILYQLVTGHLPFEAETPLGIVIKHIAEPLLPPTAINPELPPGIEAVIMRALAKAPEDRYQTAKEFAVDLERAAADQSTESIALEPSPGLALPTAALDVRAQDQAHQQERGIPPGASVDRPPSATSISSQAVAARPKHRRLEWWIAVLALLVVGGSIALFATGGAAALERLLAAQILHIGTSTPAVIGIPTPTPDAVATAVAVALATHNAQATYEATVHFTPSPSPTHTPTSTPTPDLTATAIAACVFDLEIVRDSPVWPSVLMPGQRFVKRWQVKNIGTCAWPEGAELVLVSGDELEVVEEAVIELLALEESTEIQITLRAPTRYGWYTSVWQFQDSDGNSIGEELEIACYVGSTPTSTSVPATETPSAQPSPTQPSPTQSSRPQATKAPSPPEPTPAPPQPPPPTAAQP
jgi:serine/threonine protein kinase